MKSLNVPQKLEAGKLKLKKLTPEQIEDINEYLASVGEYGEIHLVVQNGELRYINTLASHKAWMAGNEQEKDFSKMK